MTHISVQIIVSAMVLILPDNLLDINTTSINQCIDYAYVYIKKQDAQANSSVIISIDQDNLSTITNRYLQ